MAVADEIVILYGSQTGTAEGLAKSLLTFTKARGIGARISTMDSFDYEHELAKTKKAVFITSTFYNGEFPDNASKFWKFLCTLKTSLNDLEFAVFGIGSSVNANNFNRAAKMLEARLLELQGKCILPASFGDEYDENGHESAFRPWLRTLLNRLGSSKKLKLPTYFLVEVDEKKSSGDQYFLKEVSVPSESETSYSGRSSGFTLVPVIENKLITTAGYSRPAYKIVLDISKSNSEFSFGSYILVKPKAPVALVDRVLKRFGLSKETNLKIHCLEKGYELPKFITTEDLVSKFLDFSQIPSRNLLELMSCVATDTKEAEELASLAEDLFEGNPLSKLCQGDVFSIIDAFERFKSVSFNLSELCTHIPQIKPRYYSSANSPLVNKDRIDFVYNKENWPGKQSGKHFEGLCSTYLSQQTPGSLLEINLVPGVLTEEKLFSRPIVGVAMGTGIGVFRSILQHLSALKSAGKAIRHLTLFFGTRSLANDFLLREDLEKFAADGFCDLIPSFSHDQVKFITPVDKIAEAPKKVASAILDEGALYLYCGLGKSVPGIVENAVCDAISQTAGKSSIESHATVDSLKKSGRWFVEAFSEGFDSENAMLNLKLKKKGHGGINESIPMADQFEGAKMFCFQCEQTNQGRACTTVGVCGKTPEVAYLQDLIIYKMKILSWFAHRLRQRNIENEQVNRLSLEALFSTLTNVNFDADRMINYVKRVEHWIKVLKEQYESLKVTPAEAYPFAIEETQESKADVNDIEDLVGKGKRVGILPRFRNTKNDALVGLQEMLVYGLKGVCAYSDHALLNNMENPKIYEFVHEALQFLLTEGAMNLDKVLGMLLKCGEANLWTMELLHKANTTYGQQSPHTVKVKPVPGKCILVSGHDLRMLEDLLNQTKGTGINVYTHGEMLPAHGYPKLRDYGNLVGHFGHAWQRQSVEFPSFPGPIVMTTNCLTRPKDEYSSNLYTAGAVGWPGIKHIPSEGRNFDFSGVIKHANEMKGFSKDDVEFNYEISDAYPHSSKYNVGFGHELVISLAGEILKHVSSGDITRFYVIGGCDGFEGERNYFTDLAKMLPPTSVVLTAGCGKYRINHLDFQTIGSTGIPRLLDLGQCNDSYSAVQIAVALAGALNCGVNDLPLSIVLSWFEQKAIAVLLTLLFLGIKNIRVGPQLPAFLRSSVVAVLNEKFGLRLVGNPEDDLKDMLKA